MPAFRVCELRHQARRRFALITDTDADTPAFRVWGGRSRRSPSPSPAPAAAPAPPSTAPAATPATTSRNTPQHAATRRGKTPSNPLNRRPRRADGGAARAASGDAALEADPGRARRVRCGKARGGKARGGAGLEVDAGEVAGVVGGEADDGGQHRVPLEADAHPAPQDRRCQAAPAAVTAGAGAGAELMYAVGSERQRHKSRNLS